MENKVRKFKVRFHLAPGKNFMKWQIKEQSEKGLTYYLNPEEHFLRLFNCKLVNRPTTAKKIHEGAHKTVCAWVECEDFKIEFKEDKSNTKQVYYNPRVSPNWIFEDKNADGMVFEELTSVNRSLYKK